MCTATGVQEEIEDATVIEGTISHGALLEGPGSVLHTGQGPVTVGSTSNTHFLPQAAVNLVAGVLNEAGFEATVCDNTTDLVQAQWQKLGVNTVINPLTAILGVKNGALIGKSKQMRFV